MLKFYSVIESKANLQSLTFSDCHVSHREELRAAILSRLQPQSLLRSLMLHHDNLSAYGRDYDQLWKAVETSSLERFSIGTIASRESCLALIAGIPKIQVRTLEFHISSGLQYMKGDIIWAIRRNVSIRTIAATADNPRDWLDHGDKVKLNHYASRNEFVPRWIENPVAMCRSAWPEAMGAAQTTGPDTVFRILRALAPFLEPFQRERCRKRRRPESPL
jgi:hypothetical protein